MRPLVRLALLAAVLLLAAACSSGENERTASIIHRLLLAAGTETSGQLEGFVGRLPEDIPVDPPRYPGSDLIISNRQPAPASAEPGPGPGDPGPASPQAMLYFIVYDTPDGREDVFEYYEEALDKDPWQIEGSFSSEQLDTLQFSNIDDIDVAGAVSIARGGEDGRTTIFVSLQDAGAFRDEQPPFELGESLPLPKEFPEDVPVYSGSTITESAFFREPGRESFLLIFLTSAAQDDVIDFYRERFQERGWTVLAGAPFGLEERIDFRDGNRDVQGEVVADRFARDRRFTEVSLTVRVNPARDTSGDDDEPDPTPRPTALDAGEE